MIIGIDASKAAVKSRTGVENFVYQLILHLSEIDRQNIYFLYTNSPLPAELKKRVNFIEKLILKKRFWNSFFLPLALRKDPCDVYLQPTDKIPGAAPKKSTAVVHDLASRRFPSAYSVAGRFRQFQALRSYATLAQKIICVSRSTRKDFLKLYPKLKNRAEVVPLGFDSKIFHSFDHPRDLLKVGAPYIISVGRIEERKNTARLTKAFIKLKTEKNIPHKLVLIGTPGHNFKSIYKLIRDSNDRSNEIIMTGHVSHEKLPEIIARADVFAFPSLYEGFGLSVLEALACGVAVVTSNSSSLPEVVGHAALLCDPEDEDDIADKIYLIVSDQNLRQKYANLATKQAGQFSWDKTARQILDILEGLK